MTPAVELSPNWLVFGSPAAPVPPVVLRAGPLRLLYEPASGFVRRICLGQTEVLRGIYGAVRDRNWGTTPGLLRETAREAEEDSFHIEFTSEHRQDDIHFVWRGVVRGRSDGTIRYDFDGQARSRFLRNRIGFCVLHPARECAGAPGRQTRVDGSVVERPFPDVIEPQIFGQSTFRELTSVAHEVAPGLWAEVGFEGDVFEMEDQRNWTDASFKTYCTPLALPFPVAVAEGARIRQSVALRLIETGAVVAGARIETDAPAPDPVRVWFPESLPSRPPRLGLAVASHEDDLTNAETSQLRALGLAHLRADVRLSAPDWPRVLDRAARQAQSLGAGLELALHLPRGGGGDMEELRRILRASSARVERVLALREGEPATSPDTLRLARQAVEGLGAPVGAGSDANFCELNREQALGRLALAEADFLFWALTPQVHAFDNLSVIETLDAQSATLRTARMFAGGRPLLITPVTLKPRFNAVATSSERPAPSDQLPPAVDPRQLSWFAAAWTLGSLAAMAGAESLTCYETTGWRGVMERERGSPVPEKFPSAPGAVFPLFHVLAEAAGLERFGPAGVSDGSRVAAMAGLSGGGRRRVLLGNLTPGPLRIQLQIAAPAITLRWLDATALGRPPSDTRLAGREGSFDLELPPHGLGQLEELTGPGGIGAGS